MNYADLEHKNLNNGQRTRVCFWFPADDLKNQFHEIFENDVYNPHTNKKDLVVVDMGANVGLASLYFKDMAKKIYAIEPCPETFKCLEENTKMYPNIERFNYAISVDDNVKQKFSGDSLFAKDGNPIEVDTMTFGTFLKQNKIKHIDVLKIDVEGWEYVIFSEPSFRKNIDKIDIIVGESHYAPHINPSFIPVILDELGFKVEFDPNPNLLYNSVVCIHDTEKKYTIFEPTNFIAKRMMLRQAMRGLINKKDLVGAEIGVWQGTNAKTMLNDLDIKKLYLVDPYEKYTERGYTFDFDYNETQIKARETIGLDKRAEFIIKPSTEAAKQVPDNSLDFVYIDGNHDYDFVLKDIQSWLPKLKKGGLMSGHDFDKTEPGVVKAVTDYCTQNNLTLLINDCDWWWIV